MAIDREDTLRKAEKLLRQGRLDAAIAEYVRVVEDQPRDWTTTNALGDLYVRAGQVDKAVVQYGRIADHFFQEGFYPKAAALYKKILKITPHDENAQLRLAEIAARQGLLADAKAHLAGVAEARRKRGDLRAADEILVRMADLDPGDLDARVAAARALVNLGDTPGAVERLNGLATDLLERGRPDEALAALREVVRLDAANVASRARLARAYLDGGDMAAAREFLTREVAGHDAVLLLALVEIGLGEGRHDEAREIIGPLLASDPALRDRAMQLGWALCDTDPAAAFVCLDAVADAATAVADWAAAAAVLHEFVTRVPNQIPALMKLVEICVDGGLEATMYLAQAQLADAYLNAGRAAEARVIAEDLVAREPWERAHIERFRQSLVILGEPDPDSVVAERLSGSSPFTSTDHFADLFGGPAEAAKTAAPEPPIEAPRTERGGPFEIRLDGIDLETAPAAEQKAAGPAPAGPMEFDLTGVLGDLTPSAPVVLPPTGSARPRALDDVFKEMREASSRQVSAETAAQQYKLALTYRDMGMIDEAITALDVAARSPRHRFEAASLLGRIYRERGMVGQSVDWLERAAEAPAPTAEDGWALLYDLGETLEQLGETARALAVFLELQADAGTFRDVSARVDRLARVQTGG